MTPFERWNREWLEAERSQFPRLFFGREARESFCETKPICVVTGSLSKGESAADAVVGWAERRVGAFRCGSRVEKNEANLDSGSASIHQYHDDMRLLAESAASH
jgi:hypothetical protein